MSWIVRKERLPYRNVRDVVRAMLTHDLSVLVIIAVVLIVFFGVLSKGFTLTLDNVLNVMLQSSTRGIAAIGQTFVILAGEFDLAVGGIAVLAMTFSGLRMTTRVAPGVVPGSPTLAIALMMLLGIGLGATSGLAVSRLRIPSLIVTLSLWTMTEGIALFMTKGYTVQDLPRSIAFFGQGRIGGIPVTVVIYIAVAIVAHLVLRYTTFGSRVYAVGGNPVNAWLCGINVRATRLTVYMISGLCAAIAGLIIMSRTMTVALVSAKGLELDSIAAVCIGGVSLAGGKGSIIGAVLGTVIVGIVYNGMSVLRVSSVIQYIATGAIIYAAVVADYLRRGQADRR